MRNADIIYNDDFTGHRNESNQVLKVVDAFKDATKSVFEKFLSTWSRAQEAVNSTLTSSHIKKTLRTVYKR